MPPFFPYYYSLLFNLNSGEVALLVLALFLCYHWPSKTNILYDPTFPLLLQFIFYAE